MKKCRRIASFLMLSTSKNEKSRRIVASLMLSSLTEEVSRIAAFFDVVKFKT